MEGLNFFEYTDNDSVCAISRIVRDGDGASLRKVLNAKRRRKERSPLPADNRGWTAVHVAASRPEGHECLKLLLRFGRLLLIDVNARSFDGKTALFIACEEGCEKNALSLLKNGGDVNAKTLDGSSPLHVASTKGYVELVRLLCEYGAAVNDQDWQGFTSLHLAALYDRSAVFQALLEYDADTHLSDSDGNLALHLACQRGNLDIVRSVLEKKRNEETDDDESTIDRQNEDGITPLMLAVQNRQNELIVDYLLRRGASTKTQNKDGFIALQYAAVGGNGRVLRTLLDRTQVADIRENCFRRIGYVLENVGLFYPVVCCALNSASVECLAVLVESTTLQKTILEAPYAENDGRCTDVFSPLAYLFSVGSEWDERTFDVLLKLLLTRNIVYTDTFARELELKWPLAGVNYANPYAIICSNSQWSSSKKFAYMDALDAHDVTPDYCLRCYCDSNATTKFQDFDIRHGYATFYKPVLDAVCDARVEMVYMFLSRSRILEPDRLRSHLVSVSVKSQSYELDKNSKDEDLKKIRSMYHYLVDLKPSYYERNRCDNVTTFSLYLSTEEEFSRCNLQQLCRNVIRKQLRGDTILDNLRFFHRNVQTLPLPAYLKDYLLFKS